MKIEGWEGLLNEYAADVLSRPVQWGTLDCCQLAAGWVHIATGYELPPSLSRYRSPKGALGALKRFAGGDVMAAARKIATDVGAVDVDIARAQRGDVLAFREAQPFGAALGVCMGAQALSFHDDVVMLAPSHVAFHAWRL